jgi:hypothetical protein
VFGAEIERITFDEFLELIEKGQPEQPGEGPDPKVTLR